MRAREWYPCPDTMGYDLHEMKKTIKKKKNKQINWWDKKFFVVDVDMFRVDIGFCINSSEKEAANWIKKMSGDQFKNFDLKELNNWDTDAQCLGRMIPFMGSFIILIKPHNMNFRDFVGTLTHECVHVAQYLLRNRRIPLSEDTEEVHAYLTEHLVTHALKKSYK